MTTPRLDRTAIRDHARLMIIREAATVRRPDGRTIAEILEDLRPTFYLELDPGERCRRANLIAEQILPGGQWLGEVVAATLEYWSAPSCPRSHRKKLALPKNMDYPGSIADVMPSDLGERFEYQDAADEEYLAKMEKNRVHRPERRQPAPSPSPVRSRARRQLTKNDARLIAEYQFGDASYTDLAKQNNRSIPAVRKLVIRAAELAEIKLRTPNAGGRPAKG